MTNTIANTNPEPTISLLRLKAATAPKLGQNAGGSIHYEVLADTARQVLLLRLTRNESGGNFSPEAIPFSRVQAVADALPPGSPVPSRVFRSCYRGRSQNNQGFLCCLLRAEGLLGPVEGKLYQHHVTGDWPAWAADMLRQPGEPAELPLSEPHAASATTATAPTASPMARVEFLLFIMLVVSLQKVV